MLEHPAPKDFYRAKEVIQMRSVKLSLAVLLLGTVSLLDSGGSYLTGEVRAQGQSVPVADYGDAPDNLPCGYSEDPAQDTVCKFPTLFATTNARVPGRPGAHALITSQEALGTLELVSVERDANDPNDPDQTPNLIDDDTDDGLRVEPISTGVIRFKATIRLASTAPPGPRYLNALYDLNRDGEWRTSPQGEEWLVKNFTINLVPGGEQEVEIPVPVSQNWIVTLSQPRWLRLALTREPIPEALFLFVGVGGWDGSGAFSAGEIEDYKIGAVRTSDIAWAARSAYRNAWASAQATARAISQAAATARAQADAIARAEAEALALANAIARAKADAQAAASACALARTQADAAAASISTAATQIQCVKVQAGAIATAKAHAEAAAKACAIAITAASAAAEAEARALAWVQAIADARARARALASALAEAKANAEARARALATAWADARAWSSAVAQVLVQATGQASAPAIASALAWAQALAWASVWVDAQASASAQALAQAHAIAVATAHANALAAAKAIAEAEASARAYAVAAAGVFAIAEAAAKALAGTATWVSAQVVGDCCKEGGYCPTLPPQPPTDLRVEVFASAMCAQGVLREIHVSWNSFGGVSPVFLTLRISFPGGQVLEFQGLPPSGSQTIPITIPGVTGATVIAIAKDARGSSAQAQSTVKCG